MTYMPQEAYDRRKAEVIAADPAAEIEVFETHMELPNFLVNGTWASSTIKRVAVLAGPEDFKTFMVNWTLCLKDRSDAYRLAPSGTASTWSGQIFIDMSMYTHPQPSVCVTVCSYASRALL